MNKIKIIKVLMAILSPLIVCFLAWAAGFDFDQRGEEALFVSILCLIAIGGSLTYPE